MLLSLCTGKKFKKNKKKFQTDVDDDDDEDNIAPVIFQQKYINLPPQFDDELESRNKKNGITIYVGGQLTPAIPPNLNYVYSNNNNRYSYNNDQYDIDSTTINDEAPPIKPRNESYGKRILDSMSMSSMSFSDVDKSMISHRRYSSQINRQSLHNEHNRRYSAGPDNSFYGKASETSRFNYFNTDVIPSNDTSFETNEEDMSQNILSNRPNNQNFNSVMEENMNNDDHSNNDNNNDINNNNNDYKPLRSSYDLSQMNKSLDEIKKNMEIVDNDNNGISERNSSSESISESASSSSISTSSNSDSKSKTYNTNRTSQSESVSESGTTQSVTEVSESTESEMELKYNNNKSDVNANSGINNDTTLKDPTNSVNKDSNDEIPTLTNNKDNDITENDIDTMNSMEKLKYIENSYDQFMISAKAAETNEELPEKILNTKPSEDLNEYSYSYSLQDDSSLFDEAPREIRATYPIPPPKKKIKILIFGTRDSWYIQYENGEEAWNNIPTFLQWRLEVQRKMYPDIPVTWLSMSSDGWCWFVRFADGSIAWRTTIVSLHLLLEKHHTKGTVSKVTFCRNNGWVVVFCDGQVTYSEIPYSLESELSKYPHHIEDVTISERKEWVIRRNMIINPDSDNKKHHKSYSIQRNGYYTWSNGLSSFLQDNLIHKNKNIKNIKLCSGTGRSYFLQYNNYHSAFRHHKTLTNEINNFKEGRKPFLNPFTVRFSTHTVSINIKTDTNVRKLVKGVRNKTISFDKLPELRVVQDPRDGRWWALDNYWLWVLKEAGIRRVPIEIIPWTKEFLKNVRGKWDVTVINKDYKPRDY